MSIADEHLTPNFTLFELTATTHTALQVTNRIVTWDQIQKLKQVSLLLELVRSVLNVPLVIHSGYRCPELNKLVGSSVNSQHLKCEAVDFVSTGLGLVEAFGRLRTAAKLKKFDFGQLIYEKAERAYGTTEWLHISLGVPHRDQARCSQVLTMNDGQYQLIEQLAA